MRKKFDELIRVIRIGIVEEDAFGLLQAYQMSPPGRNAFAFPRSADKVDAFMRWLQQQVDRGILYVQDIEAIGVGIEQAWTNKYISDSYKRGVMRARYELNKAGFGVPSMDATGGIEVSMSAPVHLDRVGLLFTRVFNDLKGITDAMDLQISRVLAQGMADGDNPIRLAQKLTAVINGKGVGDLGITDTLGRFIPARRRAEILARTEIIRAHHQATIQEYRNWAVRGVIVKAEWMTAGDNRVCNQCADLQGEVFTLDQVQNMIPLHPQCRCIALPYIERR
jgi:SPP1 gp7 family putative phage head morphogenesis protein